MTNSLAAAYEALAQNDFKKSLVLSQLALEKLPTNIEALNIAAISLYSLEQIEQAISHLNQAILTKPSEPSSYTNLLNILCSEGKFEDANDILLKAKAENLASPLLEYYQGKTWHGLENYVDAANLFEKLWHQNHDQDAAIEYAVCLSALNKDEKAIEVYESLIALNSTFIAHNNLANIYMNKGKLKKALVHYEHAFNHNNANKELVFNYAFSCYQMKNYEKAKQILQYGLNIDNDDVLINAMLVTVLGFLDEEEEAFQLLNSKTNKDINDDINYLVSLCYYTLRTIRYDLFDKLVKLLPEHNLQTTARQYHFSHFEVLHVCFEQQLAANLSRLSNEYFTVSEELFYEHKPKEEDKHKKIRLGYISADFRNHCVALLLNDSLKFHDREKFSVTAFYREGNMDEYTEIIKNSVDEFIVLDKYDYEKGEKILHEQVDILIDLTGFTGDSCCAFFNKKPCPVQAHMIGDLPPLGVNAIDYCIVSSDIKDEELATFDEKIVQLDKVTYARAPFEISAQYTKAELGLPEDKKILACFSQIARVTPSILKLWLDVLKMNPECVLWLKMSDEMYVERMKRYAEEYNQTSQQLFFKNPGLLTETGNIKHADLYLNPDLLGCFTSVIISLDSGVPVVTLEGATSFARDAASLLTRLDCTECIAKDEKDYITIADKLINEETFYNQVVEKIKTNKKETLNNPERYIKELEAAYEKMWACYTSGEGPKHIKV